MSSFWIVMAVLWSAIAVGLCLAMRNLWVAGRCEKASEILREAMHGLSMGTLTKDEYQAMKDKAKRIAGAAWPEDEE